MQNYLVSKDPAVPMDFWNLQPAHMDRRAVYCNRGDIDWSTRGR